MQDKVFQLQVSKTFVFLYACLFVTTGMVVLLLTVSWVIKLAIFGVLILYCHFILKKYGLQLGADVIHCIRICSDTRILITTKQHVHPVMLAGDSTVTGWVCVLRFCLGTGARKVCVIFKDSLRTDEYRQLLIALRKLPRVQRSTG